MGFLMCRCAMVPTAPENSAFGSASLSTAMNDSQVDVASLGTHQTRQRTYDTLPSCKAECQRKCFHIYLVSTNPLSYPFTASGIIPSEVRFQRSSCIEESFELFIGLTTL
jgi:hypothetical protein